MNFAAGKMPLGGNSTKKCIYNIPAQVTAKHHAKFGCRPLGDVGAVTKPRHETGLNLLGCHKLGNRSQPLMGQSSAYCEDIWKRYFCFTGYFSDCRYRPQLRRYSSTKLCNGAQMAIFCVIFASCISSEPRAAH